MSTYVHYKIAKLKYKEHNMVAVQSDYLNNQAGLRPDCRIGGDWTSGYNGLAVITDCPILIHTLYRYYTALCAAALALYYRYYKNIPQILYIYYTFIIHTPLWGWGCFGLHRKKLCLITDIGKDDVITYWHMQHHRRVVLCVCRACVAYSALHYQHIASFYHILRAPDPNCSICHHVQY